MHAEILLASASPRRKQLLEQLGFTVRQQAADVDESILPNECDRDYVLRIATAKAQALNPNNPDSLIVAADTIISLDGQVIGKPKDFANACQIWQSLANRWHQVLTAVVVCYGQQHVSAINRSEVFFSTMTEQEQQWYWQTGEPQDKAGAYAIQGIAAQWIPEIKGSFSAVMGLPLYELNQLLKQVGAKHE